jgi:hypothetical protein
MDRGGTVPVAVPGPVPTPERAEELKDHLEAEEPTSGSGLLNDRFGFFRNGNRNRPMKIIDRTLSHSPESEDGSERPAAS